MQFQRTYTDARLIEVVPLAKNMSDVLRRLGLSTKGRNHATVRRHIERLGIDTSHFRRWTPRYTRDELVEAVANSESIASTLRQLGLVPRGANYRTIKQEIDRAKLSTEHFKGKSWLKGKSIRTGPPAIPILELLVDGRRCSTSDLKARLLREGLKRQICEICRTDSWQDHPIPLELDHINGRPEDNRLKNLRLLCPNCHAMTDSYRGKNIRKKR